MKNNSTIVINGRHYDARTGKPLHGHKPRAEARQHTAPGAPAGHKSAAYRPTKHIKAHKAEPAHTLMRQAVRKPGPSAKRHIKVQGRLGAKGGRGHSRIITHREPETYALHARNHAVKVTHSRLISHFSPELFSVDSHTSLSVYGSGPVQRASHRPVRSTTAGKLSTDELLDYAVQHAKVPQHRFVKRRRRIIRHPHAHHHA